MTLTCKSMDVSENKTVFLIFAAFTNFNYVRDAAWFEQDGLGIERSGF